jgi:hypothetical protein
VTVLLNASGYTTPVVCFDAANLSFEIVAVMHAATRSVVPVVSAFVTCRLRRS